MHNRCHACITPWAAARKGEQYPGRASQVPRPLTAAAPWASHDAGVDYSHQRQRLVGLWRGGIAIGRDTDPKQATPPKSTSGGEQLQPPHASDTRSSPEGFS